MEEEMTWAEIRAERMEMRRGEYGVREYRQKEGWGNSNVKELLMGAESDAEDRVCIEQSEERAEREERCRRDRAQHFRA